MKQCVLCISILTFILSGCNNNKDASLYEASARVIDGDTIILGNRLLIRLWGIDALEDKQFCELKEEKHLCGKQASEALQQIINDQIITCRQKDIDQYQRIIAICVTSEGVELNKEMVRKGWAVDYTYYSAGTYRLLQHEAFKAQRGMWQYDYIQNPRVWRKENLVNNRLEQNK